MSQRKTLLLKPVPIRPETIRPVPICPVPIRPVLNHLKTFSLHQKFVYSDSSLRQRDGSSSNVSSVDRTRQSVASSSSSKSGSLVQGRGTTQEQRMLLNAREQRRNYEKQVRI